MNGKPRRNVGAICACAMLVGGCTAPQPKSDVREWDDDTLTGSGNHPSPLVDAPVHDEAIYVDTFHGTVRLIGLVDIGGPHTPAFDLDTGLDSVDHVHTDPIHIDGACLLFSEPEASRGN